MRRVSIHTDILRVYGHTEHTGIHCTLRIHQSHRFALRPQSFKFACRSAAISVAFGAPVFLALPKGRESLANMGKAPVRLKEVVYTLSPYHQQVMASLWKDIPYKLGKKFHENWVSAFTLVVPITGTYMYAENYREKDKLHHRY